MPYISTNFTDLLDPRFESILVDAYTMHEDMIPKLYDMVPSNGRNIMSYSGVSTLPDFREFTGAIQFQDQTQGYDVTMTFKEWVNGFTIERKLIDDDQFNIFDESPRELGTSAFRTRQGHAARPFNNAFSVDTMFYSHTEGVALCSDSHTTTTGVSTASGFDNKITAELTAVGVATARIQMRGFLGTQGERISIMPDTLLYPKDLYEQAFEIINSGGKLDVANNNVNVHQGRYTGWEWNYLNDTDNWFMIDSTMLKQSLKWCDRVSLEYGFVEDFDSMVAKYRAYMRYAMLYRDWRPILGSQVT